MRVGCLIVRFNKRAIFSLVTTFTLVISNPTALQAEFELNFTPNGSAGSDGSGWGGDGAGGWSNVECNASSTGGGSTGWGGDSGGGGGGWSSGGGGWSGGGW